MSKENMRKQTPMRHLAIMAEDNARIQIQKGKAIADLLSVCNETTDIETVRWIGKIILEKFQKIEISIEEMTVYRSRSN